MARSAVQLQVILEIAYKEGLDEPTNRAKIEALHFWQQKGMMESNNGKYFKLTEKGEFFVEALKKMPLPIQKTTFEIPKEVIQA